MTFLLFFTLFKMSNNLNKALLSEGFIDTLIENEYFIDTLFENEYFNMKLLSKITKRLKYEKDLDSNEAVFYFNNDDIISTYDEFIKLNSDEMIYVLDHNNFDSIITLIIEACDKHWFHMCFLKSNKIFQIIEYLINNNIQLNDALLICHGYSLIYEIISRYMGKNIILYPVPAVYKLVPVTNNFEELYQKMTDKRKLRVFSNNNIQIDYLKYEKIDTSFILKYLFSTVSLHPIDFHYHIKFEKFISIFKSFNYPLLDCSTFINLFTNNDNGWNITINSKIYCLMTIKSKIVALLKNVYNIENDDKAKQLLEDCLL